MIQFLIWENTKREWEQGSAACSITRAKDSINEREREVAQVDTFNFQNRRTLLKTLQSVKRKLWNISV